jgi:hypothetical protein
MLELSVLLFAIGALGGLVLANSVLRGKLAPWALSLLHAGLGAAGLIVLIIALLGGAGGELLPIALLVLVVAALGGFFLASFHLRDKAGPKPVVVIHALVAVTGFVLLAGTVFSIF